MRKLVTALCIVLSAGACFAAQDGKVLSSDSVAASKAIGVEQIRAVDHVGETRYALIIGIDDYSDRKIPDLKTCQADAVAVYEILTDTRYSGVAHDNAYLLLGPEANTLNIKKHLAKLRKIPKDSMVFVYFSGHGAKQGDEAFWVTQNSEIDSLAATGLADSEIRRFISKIPSERVLVMLDCCYAAATIEGHKTVANDFSGVLKKFTGKGRAYLMAAGSGEEAIEAADLKRSVFTHYLVEGMRGKADSNRDGVVVLTELTSYLDIKVADEARVRGGLQRPVVRMDNVTEPAKFKLTVDPYQIARNIRETSEVKALQKTRIAQLRKLGLDNLITKEQYQEGRKLSLCGPAELSDIDARRLEEFIRVLDDKMHPSKLGKALDLIDTPDIYSQKTFNQAMRKVVEDVKIIHKKEPAKVALLRRSGYDGKRTLLDKYIEDTISKLLDAETTIAFAGITNFLDESMATLVIDTKLNGQRLALSGKVVTPREIYTISNITLSVDDSLSKMAMVALAARNEMNNRIDLKPDKVELSPLELTYSITGLHNTGGIWKTVPVKTGTSLDSGDCFKINFKANEDCFVHVILYGSGGIAQCLFPHEKITLDKRMTSDLLYVLPDEDNWYYLDNVPGVETIYIIACYEPMTDIAGLLTRMEQVSQYTQGTLSRDLQDKISDIQTHGLASDKYVVDQFRGLSGITSDPKWELTHKGKVVDAVTELVSGTTSVVKVISFEHK